MKDNIQELLPFYALGVLTEAEEAELQSAITANAPVRTKVDRLNYAVNALAYYPTPITPSPQVKQTLLARINNKPVDQPVVRTANPPVRPAAETNRGRNSWQQLFRPPVLIGLAVIIIVLVGLWASWLQVETTRLRAALTAVQNDLASLRVENETVPGQLARQYEQLKGQLDNQVTAQNQENERLSAALASQSQQLAAISNEVVELPATKEALLTLAQNQGVQQNNLATLTAEIAALRNQNVLLARELLAQRTVMAQAISPDVRVMALTGTDALPQAYGQLFADPFGETAALVVYGLPPLQPGQVYKFWLVAGDQPQEAGIIQVDAGGLGMLVVTTPAAIGTYNSMGISIEPASATNQPPENEMIMVGDFSS